MPFGLMFHHFHGGLHKPDKANSLSAHQFEKILYYIGIQNILSPKEWITSSENGKLQSNNCCITFDDGLKNQFDIALPVLQKLKLKAFWFIYSAQYENKYPRLDIFRRFRNHYFENIDEYYREFFNQTDFLFKENQIKFKNWKEDLSELYPFYSENDLKYRYIRDILLTREDYNYNVEKIINSYGLTFNDLTSNLWLTESDLQSLNDQGHILGLHSYDHPTNLKKFNKLVQKKQYYENLRFVKKISQNPVSMSHPCNSYNETTLKILSNIGIKIGFRSNMGSKDLIKEYKNLQLPREDAANILHLAEKNNVN